MPSDPSAADLPPLVAGRACGVCSLCCKVMLVEEFTKPKGAWCVHCDPGHGCRIYDRRPAICRGFHCAYLANARVPDSWEPSTCGMVLVDEDNGRRRIAHVDPDDPEAWRREPYYADLKRWAREGAPGGMQVAVYIDRRVIVVLPDSETDLGIVGDDEVIGVRHEATPFGRRYKAFKMRRAG